MAEPKNDTLRQFTDIICDKKPFAVMGLDTAGTNDDREIFHAVVQKFVYDDTANQYRAENRLELMQKCGKSIPENDLKRFGISDTYTDNALDNMDFSNRLTAFVLEELDDSLLIINGNESVVSSLKKVKGCESLYADKAEQGLAMTGTDLLGDYLNEHDTSGNTPRAYLKYMKSENIKVVTCDEKIAVFPMLAEQCHAEYGLSAERNIPVAEVSAGQEDNFVSELPKLADRVENDFDSLAEDFNTEQKFAKEEQLVAEIPSNQNRYHIEMDFTPEQMVVINALEEQDRQIKEAWSEKGKKAYRAKTAEQKVETLKQMNVLAENTADMTELHEMYRTLDRENGDNGQNNGFTVLQVGTTGFQAGDRVTQIAVATYDIDETGLTKISGFSRLVCADMEYVRKAEQLAQNGGFDAFAHGGIDFEKYKALCEKGVTNKAEGFWTVSTLSRNLATYFEKYPVSEYPVVSAGKTKETTNMDIPQELKGIISYSQGALLQSINNKNLTTEPIEFTQVIKEYTATVQADPEYNGENVLFPDKVPPEKLKGFGLDKIAEPNGVYIRGAKAKCDFMAELISRMQKQHIAMEQEKNQQIEVTEQAKARAEAIKERHSRAVRRKEKSGFQEESFQKPENSQENSDMFSSPASDFQNALQPSPQSNTLNQTITNLNEMTQNFTDKMIQSVVPNQPSVTQTAESPDRLYNNLDKVSRAMTENNAAVNELAQKLAVQNENNIQTNANIEQLIQSLCTMISILQQDSQQKQEQIQLLQEQIKLQREENIQLRQTMEDGNAQHNEQINQILQAMERKDEQHRKQTNQILGELSQFATVALHTQGQLAQTQEQNISIIENQNINAQTTNTLVQEVAAVKADGADTKESLAVFKEETRQSFDKTNAEVARHSSMLAHHETEIKSAKAEVRNIRDTIKKVAQNSAAMAQIAKTHSEQFEILSANQNELASGLIDLNEKYEQMREEQVHTNRNAPEYEYDERY